MFRCSLALFPWSVIREVVDWLDIPSFVLDLISLGRLEICDKFELIWIEAAAVM
jgi:hypothetical protein